MENDTEDEIWKQVTVNLHVSSLGNVKAWDPIHGWRGPYKPKPQANGYVTFQHNHVKYNLAREVAKAFLGPPADDETVDHKNNVRDENRITNLRWATRTEQRLNQQGRKSRNASVPDTNQDILMGEIWITIGRYCVSNMGRAQVMYPHGNAWGPIFTPQPSRKNRYALIGRGHAFHLLVAEAFLGPKPGPTFTIDHIDRNPANNRADNLRWASKTEQNYNRVLNGIRKDILRKEVEIQDTATKTWIKFDSFTAAAQYLTSKYNPTFQAAGVGLAAKRNGTYHGVPMRLPGANDIHR